MRRPFLALVPAVVALGTFIGFAGQAGATTADVQPTALSLTAPASATRAQPLAVDGTLTSLGVGLVDAPVLFSKTDLQGTHQLPGTSTDDHGSFTLHDTPKVGGPVTYTVTYSGETGYGPVTKSIKVSVSRATPILTIKPAQARYAYGRTASVTAHLGTTFSNRTLSLYAQPAGHSRRLLKTAKVDAHGNLTASTAVTVRTTFTASFAGDARWAPRSASTGVGVHARVQTAVAGVKRTDGTYRVYSATKGGAIAVKVSPNKAGEKITFVLQAYHGGSWTTVASATKPLDPTSIYGVGFWGNPGHQYRIRGQYGGDATNLAQVGAWQYAEFA